MCHFQKLKLLVWDQKKIRPFIGVETYIIYSSPDQISCTHFSRSVVVKTISLSVVPSIGFRSKTFSKLRVIAFSATIGLERSRVAAAAGSEGLIVATAALWEGLMVAAAVGLRHLTVPAATTAAGSWGLAMVAGGCSGSKVVIVEGSEVSAQAIVKEVLHFGISMKSLEREWVVVRFSVLQISHCSIRTVLFSSLIENIRTILTFPEELESHHLASTRNRGSFFDTPNSIARVGQSSLFGRVDLGRKAESASLLPKVDPFLLVNAALMVDASLSAGIHLYVVLRMSFKSLSSPGPMLAVFFQSIRPNSLEAS